MNSKPDGETIELGTAGISKRTGWLEAITSTLIFDVLVRVVYVSWFAYITYGVYKGLDSYFVKHGSHPDALFITTVMARVAVIAFSATFIFFVIVRLRPVKKSQGFFPRLAAFLGTFTLMSLVLFPVRELSLAGNILSTALAFTGSSLSIYIAFWLGRSVSIMPEARRLVTSGPYRMMRHPLYAAEEIAIIGSFFLYASPYTAILVLLHGYMQIRRMDFEEEVLRHAFPEYDEYAKHTARLIPGVY
jgi:protein-S-isoprenylcysteine O-methyltransferase Ste14